MMSERIGRMLTT